MVKIEHTLDKEKGLKIIDFKMLPVSNHTMWVEDTIYMDDNLDKKDVEAFEDAKRIVDIANPIKIMMAVILFCVKGSIKTRINQVETTQTAGGLLIVMPGAITEMIDISPGCELIACAMAYNPDKTLQELPSKSTIEVGKIFLSNANPTLFHLDDDFSRLFIQLYKTEREIISHTVPEFLQEAIKNYIQTVACMLASWTKGYSSDVNIPLNRETELFSKFINDVHNFAASERSVSFYADRACLSPKYFARIITKTSGHKPGHWIKNYVILEAKTMLGTNRYTIQQVSDNLNFPNPSFFCKYFRAETGISPGQYIKNMSI